MRRTAAGSLRRPTALFAIALTLAAVLAQVVAAPSPASAAPDTKVEQGLLALPDDTVVDFWVTFTAKAVVAGAGRGRNWQDKGKAVVDGLQRVATGSQAGVVRMLESRGIRFEPYWIANTIKVRGSKTLMRQLAARSEVAKVEADQSLSLPPPAPAADSVTPAAVEWGIAAVNAPAVWNDLSVTGQGIVVANLDTGVEFDHPALVNQYRGNLGGTFDHNYNWFDPSNACGTPSVVPCDNNQHGTHTMGTILGGDASGQNAIGVAPGARWIAVKGCESSSCSQSALLAGGQWLLAPTDLNGQNPRPDLRPNIVNNSWGGPGGNTWYRDMVTAWVAAGIFPAFSNGNSGPSCGTAGAPADYAESYAVGASNSAGAIASFSSRGSAAGMVKPDITAPGEGVRSAVPGGGYSSLSGTSMAAPHLAGAVALMWSAAPALISDVAATRTILDQTAVDVPDLTCGGTNADNGVWGEGRLDALAAVLASPRGPTGTVAGTVVDQATGSPIAGARVRSTGADSFPRVTTTGPTGTFTQRLPVGAVQVEVTAFGYAGGSASVTVAANATTPATVSLVSQPRHALTGRVLDNAGGPVPGASVSILGTPVQSATTDAAGVYRFTAIPAGDYDLSASAGRCMTTATGDLVLNADATVDFTLALHRDAFGYSCRSQVPAYVEADTVIALTGDDSTMSVALPFPFSYYGRTYSTAQVSTNGVLGLLSGTSIYTNRSLPDTATPNGSIYAFWDDLYVDASSSVRTATRGVEPDRRFVIEWRNVRFYGGSTTARLDFEVILDQRGAILLQYRGLSDQAQVRGQSATIGLENDAGTVGLNYSYNQAALEGTALALRFDVAGRAGNTPPDAVADSAATIAGRTVTIPVLGNDRDPDSDRLDVSGVSAPNGTATVIDGDVISYTPALGFTGTDLLTYHLTDGRGGTDGATISVTVAPLAVDDTGATAEDTPVDVRVLANDLNPQAGTLGLQSVATAGRGTTTEVAPGVVRYTPYADFNGSDTFQYTVRDGLGGVDTGTVSITVSPVDDPPRPVDDIAEVNQDGETFVGVLSNDREVDGEVNQLVGVSDPPHGTAVISPLNGVTYRPDAGYVGSDSFTYDISDGRTTARATVTVTVRPAATTTSSSTTSTSTSTSTTSTTIPPTTTTTRPPTTTTTTTAPPPPGTATMRAPYSVWSQPSVPGVDGLGVWVATLHDPAARPGQLAPNYQVGMTYRFQGAPLGGSVGLRTGPAGKTAVLTADGLGGGLTPQTASVPFPWTANGFYFFYLTRFGPNTFGAAVYDLHANSWTMIGSVTVPVPQGGLFPVAATATNWMGSPAATCAAYPGADVLVHAPTMFRGGLATDATFVAGGTVDGVCASVHAAGPPGWYLYRTGTL